LHRNQLKRKNDRVAELELQLSDAKEKIYQLRLQSEELEDKNQQLSRPTSELRFPGPDEPPRSRPSSNIVKVLRPSINYRGVDPDD